MKSHITQKWKYYHVFSEIVISKGEKTAHFPNLQRDVNRTVMFGGRFFQDTLFSGTFRSYFRWKNLCKNYKIVIISKITRSSDIGVAEIAFP